MPTTLRARRKLLKNTISRCPVCHQPAPAGVWNESQQEGSERVVLTRSCPEHGKSEAVISSDARFYWLARGSDDNRCGAGCACSADPSGLSGTLGKNAFAEMDATIEQLSTCLALIEIVDSCNLACPTCFADSPVGTHSKLKYHSLPELQKRITGVLERKQHIEILQLSGGEPTLHPDFFELLDWIHEQAGIDYALINTNGVRLAKDDKFLKQLGERVSRGHIQLYLQFDGPQEAGQLDLRGADLRKMKQQAMERCQSIGLPVTLAMTVNEHNLPNLWDTIEWGIGYDNCRGVSFQPMFLSGRSTTTEPERRMNTADIILGAVEQAAGRLKFDDFTPLPCGDPNCATIGYLLKTPQGIRSISDFINFTEVQGFL